MPLSLTRRFILAVATACLLAAVPATASAADPGWVIDPTPSLPSALPPPAGPGGTAEGGFSGVSCATTDACAAVGQSSPGNMPVGYLAEHWDGTAWSAIETSNLAFDFGSQLLSVSCAAPEPCIAVGSGNTPDLVPVAQSLSSTGFQDVSPAARSNIEELLSVSCVSTSECMAVGNTGDFQAPYLIIHAVSGAWTNLTAALPADGAPGLLTGVSCASSSFCVAVGSDDDGNLLAEAWDGTSWSLAPAPDPAPGSSSLGAVSCSAVGECLAIGGQDGQPLVERLRHGTWEVLSAPPATSNGAPSLSGISCPSRGTCIIVGSTSDAGGSQHAFAARLGHGRWHVQATPAVPGATGDSLAAVSCPTRRVCIAVGQSRGPSDPAGEPGSITPLAERWLAGGHRRSWWHRHDDRRSHRYHRGPAHRR